ncbi:MAG: hypothetical protein WBH50_26590, partial [Fuerstiella sp.]
MAISKWLGDLGQQLNLKQRSINRKRFRKRRPQHQAYSVSSLERLESRELLTATLGWDGDDLQITGSEGNDFIAVQQDQLGLKVFTEDGVFTEYEGRSLSTASSVSVSGLGGNDVLFSYQTNLPVSLHGDDGNDFLYSDTTNDVLEGGQGFNWIQSGDSQVTSDAAFGISGLDLTITPQFDEDGRIGLQVDATGDVDLAGAAVAVTGGATVTEDGVALEVTGAIANWDDAFGLAELDLTNTNLTISAGSDVNDGDGYRVDLSSSLQVSGTDIGISGSVDVQEAITTAAFTGRVANWDDAFGIVGLDLTDSQLHVVAQTDFQGAGSFEIDVLADLHVEGTAIAVSGSVDVEPDQIDAVFSGL